jgi:2-keto-3-deoxy-L-rhamnonate aldolase RhmA
MSVRDNHTKGLLASGAPAFGVSLTIGDPFVAEMVGSAGLDFVMIDAQHAPLPVDSLQAMLIAMRTSPSTLLVRTAGNDATVIGQILDIGAEGVIVPDVTDRNSCLAAVSAARYAPAGSRGFGPRRAARLDGGRAAYLQRANDEISVFVMIEHIDAVRRIGEILTTPGLDGIVVGPADLAVSLGCLNQLGHPDVAAAIDEIHMACQGHSFPFGIFAAGERAARCWVERGAAVVIIGADLQFLDQGLTRSSAFDDELRGLRSSRVGESRLTVATTAHTLPASAGDAVAKEPSA